MQHERSQNQSSRNLIAYGRVLVVVLSCSPALESNIPTHEKDGRQPLMSKTAAPSTDGGLPGSVTSCLPRGCCCCTSCHSALYRRWTSPSYIGRGGPVCTRSTPRQVIRSLKQANRLNYLPDTDM